MFDGEPQVPAELMAMENVVLTPHIASSTDEPDGRWAISSMTISVPISTANRY